MKAPNRRAVGTYAWTIGHSWSIGHALFLPVFDYFFFAISQCTLLKCLGCFSIVATGTRGEGIKELGPLLL
jgi:hypothetical protein